VSTLIYTRYPDYTSFVDHVIPNSPDIDTVPADSTTLRAMAVLTVDSILSV